MSQRDTKSKRKSVKASAKTRTTKTRPQKITTRYVIEALPRILSDENTSAGLYNLLTNTLVELSNETNVGVCEPTIAPAFYYAAQERNGAARSVKDIKEIIRLAEQGETFEDVRSRDYLNDWQDRRAGRPSWQERNAAKDKKFREGPEPKDKLSDEWRYWKLRNFEAALESGDEKKMQDAATEFRDLIKGLLADGDFWHTYNLRVLMPHIIIARQQIDRLRLQEKRLDAGVKGAATRKAKAKKGGQG